MKTSSYLPVKVKKSLEQFFEKSSLSRLAKTTGFALREAQKITAYNFVAAFLLCCTKGLNTYSEWARQISLLSGKTLRKQSLWERLHQGSVAFAKEVLQQVLLQKTAHKAKAAPLFKAFRRVLVQDSTTLRLPHCLNHLFPGAVVRGVKTAIARIQSVMDLKRMQFVHFSLGAYTENDQSASPSILAVARKGDLLIRDLGYFVLRVLQKLVKERVYILSRLRFGVSLYDRRGRPLEVKELLQRGRRVDRWVYMGATHSLWVRLVMIPVPAQVAAERVRKARNDPDKRFHHAAVYYQWLRYDVFITTVAADIWRTAEVAKAYGVRWQIEIVFKSWKSGFQLQRLLHEKCAEEYRVKTNIYLLLVFITLFMQKVYRRCREGVESGSGKVVSLLKLSALFFRNMVELLTLSPQKLKQQISLYGCYEKRKDRVNMAELINSF